MKKKEEMKKIGLKLMAVSANLALVIAVLSQGLASNFGTYQEEEPTELLQKKCKELRAKRNAK